MHPELFRIGDFPVKSFGVVIALGIALAVFLGMRRARMYGLHPDHVMDFIPWAVIFGILGARVAYILLNWKQFAGQWNQILSFQFTGLTSFGGLILGTAGVVYWSRKKKVPFVRVLDVMAVPLLAAWAVGRVACLLNGCCYGRPCAGGFCVHFDGVGNRVPAQWVDIVLLTTFAGVIWFLEGKKGLRSGMAGGLAIIAFAVSRFVYEFFRAGTPAEYEAGIATGRYLFGTPFTEGHYTSVLLVVLAVLWIVRTGRAALGGSPPAPVGA